MTMIMTTTIIMVMTTTIIIAMTMTTTSIIAALCALSCDAYTVTATARRGAIVATYHATDADLGQSEHDGADAYARIAEVLEAAGYAFSDAGSDSPGIYEVWRATAAV